MVNPTPWIFTPLIAATLLKSRQVYCNDVSFLLHVTKQAQTVADHTLAVIKLHAC